jgi:L-cysteine:1D-myo-inositol 2-amino-2-deoxy-alpha-D-glucopyranoside ligase
VRRWLHTGMVGYQGEKMSKSLGNLVFPRDLFRDHDPAAVRLALLAHHWRSDWEWDAAELKEAAERLSSWRAAYGQRPGPRPWGQPRASASRVGYAPPPGANGDLNGTGGGAAASTSAREASAGDPAAAGGVGARLPAVVDEALAGDLDTPAALAATDELAERGDGPGVAAAAAVLGVDLGLAR